MTLQLGTARSPDWRWSVLALAIFTVTLLVTFRAVLSAGLTEHVMVSSHGLEPDAETGALGLPETDSLFHTDQRFVVWLTARNARALLGGPWGFFDAGTCYPARDSLAFGEPGLSLGLVGLPAWILTRDPVATFNLVVFGLVVAAAFAMYLLVRDWTGVPAAGIVAGLLYAFSEVKMGDVVHVNVYDNAWIVLGLYFATRWVERWRWRDALGLACCIVLQVGGSFYTVMSATLIALPILVWQGARLAGRGVEGIREIHKGQLAVVVITLLAVALFVFSPYLALQEADAVKTQLNQGFRRASYLLPGAHGFWGWIAIALAAMAFAPRRHLVLRTELGDPRLAIVAATFLLVIFSIGSYTGIGPYVVGLHPEGFVPYVFVSRYVPGLDVVRAPGAILPGAHLLVCVLSGIGAATLLTRLSARHRGPALVVLIVLALVETLRPPVLGLSPRVRYGSLRMSPAHADVELLHELGQEGELGPLLEVPVVPKDMVRGSQSLVLSAYHQRETSGCYNPSRVSAELFTLSRRLPAAPALVRVYELGFRDIVLHHARDNAMTRQLQERYAEAAVDHPGSQHASPQLVRRGGTENLTVYRIEP